MPTKKKDDHRRTAIDAKRTSSDYSVPPELLYIETNRAHVLFDPRFDLPVTEDQIATWNLTGQAKDIVCRKNGTCIEVVDGMQTVKAAIEVNKRRKAEGLPLIEVRVALKSLPTDAAVLLYREIANKRKRSLPSMVASQVARMLGIGLPEEQVILAVEGVEDAAGLARYRALHELAPEVKAAVDEGRIGVRQAIREFGKLRLDEQPTALAARLSGDAPAVPAKRRPFPHIDDIRLAHAKVKDVDIHPQAAAILGWAAGKLTLDELRAQQPAIAAAFTE